MATRRVSVLQLQPLGTSTLARSPRWAKRIIRPPVNSPTASSAPAPHAIRARKSQRPDKRVTEGVEGPAGAAGDDAARVARLVWLMVASFRHLLAHLRLTG